MNPDEASDMSTTEEDTTEEEVTHDEEDSEEEAAAEDTDDDVEEDDDEDEEQETFAGKHPIGELLDSWIAWVSDQGKGDVFVDYEDDEDVFNVDRNDRDADGRRDTSDIDEEFYGDSQAIFVESIIGKPPENLDLSQTLKFSGNELVLSRISLTERHSKSLLLVESAIPISRFLPTNFDLMVREVSTIGRDLRKHLADYLED